MNAGLANERMKPTSSKRIGRLQLVPRFGI